ncbi:MAG: class I SAM-dependent rRNA methyltransferase [Candidatus Gracilibacteria bacterium]|nr:class I SAM-dependent rRNA methyltransferase [Candidatus Gracilibacteria bacterium]
MSKLPIVKLKTKREVPVRAGHPWIFSQALESRYNYQSGTLVQVHSAQNEFLGIGTFNPLNSISVRLITREPEAQFDAKFFARRFSELDTLKQEILPAATDAYRLVHADADSLPGLIIDRYRDTFVFQIHTAGMEAFREEIVAALKKTFKPELIVERSDVEARRQEGLKDFPVIVHLGKVVKEVEFTEHGIKFLADVLHGQKTGFFLDQRTARRRLADFAKDKKILNLFSYTGAFSLYAALAGAKSVTSVDVSKSALELARKQFTLNKLDPEHADYEFVAADVFDFLRNFNELQGQYDIIICDPPAFAKSGKQLEQALRAYSKLNEQCLRLLEKGGILLSSSCSGRVTTDDFKHVLKLAAGAAGKDLRVLDSLGQAACHTEKLSFPEGKYLKTFLLQLIN